MSRLRVASSALLATLAGPLSAQSAWTSPSGFLATEGDASHAILLSRSWERFMQIDDTWTGQVRTGIQRLALRRDGDVASFSGGPRSLDLTVKLGVGDWATVSDSFANNWRGTPTTVFATRRIDTPDWSTLAGARPAPFDLEIPFDAPVNHDGSGPLVVELRMTQVSAAGSPEVDRELGRANSFARSGGIAGDPGCLVAGQTLPMQLWFELQNHGPTDPNHGMRLGLGVSRAPAGQPAVVNLDIRDAAQSLPGLCAVLHALPTVPVALGATDALGDVRPTFVDLAHQPLLAGTTLYAQALVLDPTRPGLPVALSEDRQATMPDALRPSPRTAYLYAPQATDPTATLFRDRGIVLKLAR